MNEIKTVTRDNKVYQIGQDYLFSQNGLLWIYNKLIEAHHSHNCFSTCDMDYSYIKEVPASENMGTITPAPIELIDGNVYTFDLATQWVGFYVKERDSFFSGRSSGNKIAKAPECKNIRLMTVESK
jgi:hypothetical protein